MSDRLIFSNIMQSITVAAVLGVGGAMWEFQGQVHEIVTTLNIATEEFKQQAKDLKDERDQRMQDRITLASDNNNLSNEVSKLSVSIESLERRLEGDEHPRSSH
jgi:FtsZ-binding cell division protein ZapB